MSPTSGRRPALAAAAAVAVLALTASGCGPNEGPGTAAPSESAEPPGAGSGDLRLPEGIAEHLPEGLPTSLEDLDQWRDGEWRNWDREDWLREAADFFNPVIEGLWDPERMRKALQRDRQVDPAPARPDEGTADGSGSGEQQLTDPVPDPVPAQPVNTPYRQHAAPVGKIFMDTPKGPTVCSGAVVTDPAQPGRSNLVATAGHCVHAGRSGGWYRNIVFVPAYNDRGLAPEQVAGASLRRVAPHGRWWAQWAQTTAHWIEKGARNGGSGAPQDFAVLRVAPEAGGGSSLEETVGSALPVEFGTPPIASIGALSSYGYPAGEPFDGQRMHSCTDRPARLTLDPTQPTMYRIGCTMTAGASGGPWLSRGPDGNPRLFSVTSIGPTDSTWLAGPRLGGAAEDVHRAVSDRYAAP